MSRGFPGRCCQKESGRQKTLDSRDSPYSMPHRNEAVLTSEDSSLEGRMPGRQSPASSEWQRLPRPPPLTLYSSNPSRSLSLRRMRHPAWTGPFSRALVGERVHRDTTEPKQQAEPTSQMSRLRLAAFKQYSLLRRVTWELVEFYFRCSLQATPCAGGTVPSLGSSGRGSRTAGTVIGGFEGAAGGNSC